MNKRIIELADKAALEDISGAVNMNIPDEFCEKFAELIIKECCQFEKSYSGDAGLVARSYSRKIKDHFSLK